MDHKQSLRLLVYFEGIDICPVTPILLKASFKLLSSSPQTTRGLSMCNSVSQVLGQQWRMCLGCGPSAGMMDLS